MSRFGGGEGQVLEEAEMINDLKCPFFSPQSSDYQSILLEFPQLPPQFSKVGGEVYTNRVFLILTFSPKALIMFGLTTCVLFNFGFG